MEENNIFLNERLRTGYTQMEVARYVGLAQQTLSVIENDVYFGNYTFSTIKKLCNFYKIDINTIPIGG